MTYIILNLILMALLFNIDAARLHDSSQIIANHTMPRKIEDIIIKQNDGGDISREIIYPVKKENAASMPTINAISALAIDVKSGLVLFDKNSKEKRPIASITKLMTALVFLEQQSIETDKLGWDEWIEFNKTDFRNGRRYLGEGEKITIKDLFAESLIGSDNSATAALARSTGLSEDDFAKEMNNKAKELKMQDSSFSEPTGLDQNNISTARDLAKLVFVAMQKPEITNVLNKENYEFSPINKKIIHKIVNTNWLINDEWLDENSYNFIGGKTGYTDEAGYAFVCQIANKNGNGVISVILNTNSVNNRFDETKKIVQWGFGSYNFTTSP